MKISNKLKTIVSTFIFTSAFFFATTSIGLCCPKGLLEEPTAPKSLLKK
ncbi:hypothetical protein [Tepidibacter hydrothermalis]|uniref:Cyclic lactone autoinducer peptide n=1 Tax=Tepidibacter hydrothermalis TaxID=3036126 RepID=A0ABY8EAX1_9FIRM|nr:hypothetical protein [Tepidibacter hydrothermalis]WFD09946.1 hypothetical protein P4S50_16450 [Tepidibacter hydrothermalis]